MEKYLRKKEKKIMHSFTLLIIRCFCSDKDMEFYNLGELTLNSDGQATDMLNESFNDWELINDDLIDDDNSISNSETLLEKINKDFNNKIEQCKKGEIVEFSNKDIKFLLFHGIPNFQENKNVCISIFRNFLMGSYQEITQDFMAMIKISLVKITLQNILAQIDSFFINNFFERNENDNKYRNVDNKILLQKFNELLSDNDFNNVKKKLLDIYSYIYISADVDIDVKNIQNNQGIKHAIEINHYIKNDLKNSMEKLTLSKFKTLITILKDFDNKFHSENFIINQDFQAIYSYLEEQIPIHDDPKNFWYENRNVFSALKFLYNDFLQICFKKISVCIFTKKKDSIKFTSDSNMELKKIYLEYEKIDKSELFLCKEWKSHSIIIDFITTDKSFLDLINTSNIHEIKMNNFLLKEFGQNDFIGIECIDEFLKFHNNLSNDEKSILLCDSNNIYYLPEQTCDYKMYFFDSFYNFFIRYLLRESFFKNSYEREQLYSEIYDLFQIRKDEIITKLIPLSLFRKMSPYENIDIKNEILSLSSVSHEKIMDKYLILENNTGCVVFYASLDKIVSNPIILTGKAQSLSIHTNLNICGTIWSDFYHMILSRDNIDSNKNTHNMNILPISNSLNFHISTMSYLRLQLNNAIFFVNDITQNELCSILLKNNLISVMYSSICINYIPLNINYFRCFGIILNTYGKSDNCVVFQETENNIEKFSFSKSFFKTKLVIKSKIKDIFINDCIFEKNIEIEFFSEIDTFHKPLFLKIENCLGEILLSNIKFKEIPDKPALIKHNWHGGLLYIRYYEIANTIKINSGLNELQIDNCIIFSDIILEFDELFITNSEGIFYILLDKAGTESFQVDISGKSIIKICKDSASISITFENLKFCETSHSFNGNYKIDLNLMNCENKTEKLLSESLNSIVI